MALKRVPIVADAPSVVFRGGRGLAAPARVRGSIISPTVDRRDIGGSLAGSIKSGSTFSVLDLLQTKRQFKQFRRSVQVPQQAIVPAVIPRVRSRPASGLPGAGLLPPAQQQPPGGARVGTIFEDLGDIVVERARQEFLTTGGASEAGTVVEFPVQPGIGVAAPQIFKEPQQFTKRRRRRRRLLTASDKCDIAAMKAMLTTNEFKIWLACPSMFKG